MADQWYYGGDGDRQGPFTSGQLRALAVEGRIQPTDTVWKEGIEAGVDAAQVKNLFPPGAPAPVPKPPAGTPPAAEAPAAPAPAPAPVADREPAVLADMEREENRPPPPAERPPEITPRKLRALAVRGAVIANQDGVMVFFRKKCVKCNHEETGRSRLPIRSGMMRASYFCPKCRKLGPVEIQGSG